MPQAFTTDDGISSPWRQLEITRECKRLLENTRHHHASNWDYTRTSVVQVDCCSIQQSSHHLHLTIPCLEGSKMPCTQVWITSLTMTAWSTVEPPYSEHVWTKKFTECPHFRGEFTQTRCVWKVRCPDHRSLEQRGSTAYRVQSHITWKMWLLYLLLYIIHSVITNVTMHHHKCHHASWPLTVPQHIFTTWSRHSRN